MEDQNKDLMQKLLTIEEAKLKAQLKAVRKLATPKAKKQEPKHKRMSQIDIAYNILHNSDKPLHISAIINEAKMRFNVEMDRESIVSAIAKKINKKDRFIRTDKNTFTIIKSEEESG